MRFGKTLAGVFETAPLLQHAILADASFETGATEWALRLFSGLVRE
jgi:hypothetical protein